jgi:hypothetical protein
MERSETGITGSDLTLYSQICMCTRMCVALRTNRPKMSWVHPEWSSNMLPKQKRFTLCFSYEKLLNISRTLYFTDISKGCLYILGDLKRVYWDVFLFTIATGPDKILFPFCTFIAAGRSNFPHYSFIALTGPDRILSLLQRFQLIRCAFSVHARTIPVQASYKIIFPNKILKVGSTSPSETLVSIYKIITRRQTE